MPKLKRKNKFAKNLSRTIQTWRTKLPSAVFGLMFAALFSGVFYVGAIYLPMKLPLALPFLVAGNVSDSLLVNSSFEADVDDTYPVNPGDIPKDSFVYSEKLAMLDNTIKVAGIPIDGVALLSRETLDTRVDFKVDATDDQKARAQEIVQNFNWTITARDVFDPVKAKALMTEKFSTDTLVTFSPYLSMMNSFLDKKDFKKLKGFMNSLFAKGIIGQDEYLAMADVLAEQKIYLNVSFAAPAPAPEPTPEPTPETETTPAPEPTPEPVPAESQTVETAPVENVPVETAPIEVVPAEVAPPVEAVPPVETETPVSDTPVIETPAPVEPEVPTPPPEEPPPAS